MTIAAWNTSRMFRYETERMLKIPQHLASRLALKMMPPDSEFHPSNGDQCQREICELNAEPKNNAIQNSNAMGKTNPHTT